MSSSCREPPGDPWWNSSTGPSSGPVTSTSSRRPSGRVMRGMALLSWTVLQVRLVGWSVDVERRLARATSDDHRATGLVRRVGLPVDGACRHAEEVTRTGLDDVPTTGSGLHPHPAADDVERRLVVAVVVPPRGRMGLGVDGAG